jgi:hypothetical protein
MYSNGFQASTNKVETEKVTSKAGTFLNVNSNSFQASTNKVEPEKGYQYGGNLFECG